jgi:hypothetical protein
MNVEDWAFFIFGLAFFLFTMHTITRDNDKSWERRVMEAREFGFGGKDHHNAKTLHEK